MNDPKSTHYVEWVARDAREAEYTYTGPHMPKPDAEAFAAQKMRDGALTVRVHEVGAIR